MEWVTNGTLWKPTSIKFPSGQLLYLPEAIYPSTLPTVCDTLGIIERAKIPMTYCVSPHIMSKPLDWGLHIDIVGFWFLDQKSNFDPVVKVPKLVQFLKEGPPPFYVGFGSIVVDDPKSLSERVVAGVVKSGVRAIIHQVCIYSH